MGLSFGLGSSLSLEHVEPVLLKAIELGCTFWDTAVRSPLLVQRALMLTSECWVVCAAGINEKLLGDFIRKHNLRDQLFIDSKCGFDIDFESGKSRGVTNSASHIKKYTGPQHRSHCLSPVLIVCLDGTIDQLGFTPDLYYLHRVDPSTS